MGAAASILAVGFVILIVGAVIYYMTYSGKLSISKNKTSPNSRGPLIIDRPSTLPVNGNRPRILPVNGGNSGGNNGVRIQPVNGNGVVQSVNNGTVPNNNGVIVQSNRVRSANGNASPRMNSISVLPNGNGNNSMANGMMANGIRTSGPEFFVQMPSSSSNSNSTVSVRRGVRIEPVPNGINVVPVDEVDTNATIYRCEEVSI